MDVSKLLSWIGPLLIVALYSALLWLEHRRQLRRSVESKLTRNVRNLTASGLSAAAVQIAEVPIAMLLAGLVERRGLGLVSLRPWLKWPSHLCCSTTHFRLGS